MVYEVVFWLVAAAGFAVLAAIVYQLFDGAEWSAVRWSRAILAELWHDLVEQGFGVMTVGLGAFLGWAYAVKSQPSVPGVHPPHFWSWWAISSVILLGIGVTLWLIRASRRHRPFTYRLRDGTVIRARGDVDVAEPPATGSGAAGTVEVEHAPVGDHDEGGGSR